MSILLLRLKGMENKAYQDGKVLLLAYPWSAIIP